jgi:hypothetical protein
MTGSRTKNAKVTKVAGRDIVILLHLASEGIEDRRFR